MGYVTIKKICDLSKPVVSCTRSQKQTRNEEDSRLLPLSIYPMYTKLTVRNDETCKWHVMTLKSREKRLDIFLYASMKNALLQTGNH